MYVSCVCDNPTFYIKVDFDGGINGIAECTECGEEREIGADS